MATSRLRMSASNSAYCCSLITTRRKFDHESFLLRFGAVFG
jgi:hypothetical protein